MKRFLFVLLMAVAMAACTSPEERIVEFMEELYVAAKSGDDARFLEIYDDMYAWAEDVDEEDQGGAEAALFDWANNNDEAIRLLTQTYQRLRYGDYVKKEYGRMNTRVSGEYYSASWDYGISTADIVYINGSYYINLGPVLVSLSDADRAISWLTDLYTKLTDTRQKMKDAGVERIEKKITIDNPGFLYTADQSYRSTGPRYNVEYVEWIDRPSIEIDLDRDYGQGKIQFQVNSHHLTISDDSYPAMIAALKARNEMKAKLEKYINEQQELDRRKREIEDSIW